MTPEYTRTWWVATTCKRHNFTHPWKARKVSTAEQELREEFGNCGLMMSAYAYPEKHHDKHTEGFGHLYFDFDSPDGPGPAQKDARKLVVYLTETLGLTEEDFQVFFSGNKGYHVFVNAFAFGIRPMPYIHKFYGFVATQLRDRLDLPTLDLSIYNHSRLFRVTNSIHEKSGRYRINISARTLLERPSVEIKNRASQPGPTPSEFRYIETPAPYLKEYMDKAYEAFSKTERSKPIKTSNAIPQDIAGLVVGLPTCIQDILDRFLTSKHRYVAQAPLIAYMKLTGADQEETIELLSDKIRENYPPHQQADRIMKTRSCVEQIYRGDYTFSCAYALSPTKYEAPENKIKCSGSACPLYNHCGSNSAHQIEIRL